MTAAESTFTVEDIPEEKPEQADVEQVTVEVSLTPCGWIGTHFRFLIKCELFCQHSALSDII